MMNLSQNQIVLAILIGGTTFGALGTIATRVAITENLTIPEDAEIIDPTTGIVTTKESPDVAAAPTATPSKPGKANKRALIDPIIRRNMFDSTKVGMVAAPEEGETGNKTSLPLILLATMVATPEQFSSALIAEDKGDDGAMGYGVGDSVIGEATVHRIEQKRVILKRNDGELEYLAMDDAKLPEAKSGAEAKSSKAGKWDGVEKEGETKFTIDEETFNKILENPDKLANQIRAVPHTDDNGVVDGYRLSGIRRSSLFRKLGIKNGDIVHSVNGNELTSVSSALQAYESLQNERNFNFEVTTRKKKKTYEYEVR